MKSKNICANSHTYFKTSICPVCPICVQELKPTADFLAALSATARRALENKGIASLQQLTLFSKKKFYPCMVWGMHQYQYSAMLYTKRE